MRGITHSLSHWPVTLSIRLARPNALTQFARPAHSLALSPTHSPHSLTLSPTHSLAHSLARSLTRSPTRSLAHPTPPGRLSHALTHQPPPTHSFSRQCSAVPCRSAIPRRDRVGLIGWLCGSVSLPTVDWSIGRSVDGWDWRGWQGSVGRWMRLSISANRPIGQSLGGQSGWRPG